METGISIIGFSLLILVFLPFIISYWSQKSKNKKFFKHFQELSEKRNLIISQNEMWEKRYIIGIDTNSNKLLYIKKKKEQEEETLIDLSEIRNCKATKGVDSDKVELVLTYFDTKIPQLALEFYDGRELLSPQSREMDLAEKWAGIVNSCLGSAKN